MSILYDALLRAEAERDARRRGVSLDANAVRAEPKRRRPIMRRIVTAAAVASIVAGAMLYARHGMTSRGELVELAVGRPESGIAREVPRGFVMAAVAQPEQPVAEAAAVQSPSTATIRAATVTTSAATVPPPAAAPETIDPSRSAAGRFSVQVGAFRNRDNALRLRARLVVMEPSTTLVAPHSAGGLWIVRLGAFADRSAATTALAALARDGLPGIVVAVSD